MLGGCVDLQVQTAKKCPKTALKTPYNNRRTVTLRLPMVVPENLSGRPIKGVFLRTKIIPLW